MTSRPSGRAVRAILSITVLASMLAAAQPVTTVTAQGGDGTAFAKLDKPFNKLGLVPVADTTALVDGTGFPFTGSVEGVDGADITLSAVGAVKLTKQQAKQAQNAWNKAKQKAGAGSSLKAGRHLAAVFETAGPPSGDVAFYALLDGPKANDAVPGFPLDPRSGQQLAILVGILGGNIVAGDTRVAGQALTGGLQFYNVANETAVWRKGNRWYVLRPLPRGSTVADIRSQLTTGTKAYDFAAGGPAVLAGEPIPGLRCFNAIGSPEASFDGGPAATSNLQLNLVVDPALADGLDPAGLELVSVDGDADPISAEVISFDALGSTLVNFAGVPNGRSRLMAATPGAEPIVRLLPSVLRFDGMTAGSLSQGIACNSTVEGLYAAAIDACSFSDPAAIGTGLGLEPATVMPFGSAAPDGSQLCAWGAPDVFAGATYGVRLATDLDLVKASLVACEQTDLPGDVLSFVAVCPGLVQHVQLTPANVPGAGDGAGFPSGTAFLLGQNPAVDAALAPVTGALAAGDAATASELLAPLLDGDPLGYAGFADAQSGFLGS